jgi:hypothetical protein
MRLYLDDDSVDPLLIRLLRKAGHDVQAPADVSLAGAPDPVHLTHSSREDRVFRSGNHRDFLLLHQLVLQCQGHHPGIVIVRKDNDPTRDLTPRGTVRALGNLIAANLPMRDQFQILNHWR